MNKTNVLAIVETRMLQTLFRIPHHASNEVRYEVHVTQEWIHHSYTAYES